MRVRLRQLSIVCHTTTEVIAFEDLSYFWGEIASGKSTIAHLVDYCLGGRLRETPALQTEFVEATLEIQVGESDVLLTRPRGSDLVRANWSAGNETFHLAIPARKADGPAIPGSNVEVLSDLLFHLSGMKPPRVRQSKLRDDSVLQRLSVRDLLWYCYLDQADMESSFFNLESASEFAKRMKSRDVVRFVLGIHEERISELEFELDETRIARKAAEEGAKALLEALATAGFPDPLGIEERVAFLEREIAEVAESMTLVRSQARATIPHGVDTLRAQGRTLAEELAADEAALSEVSLILDEERRHANELSAMLFRFRRSETAGEVLQSADFVACPSCRQSLPVQADGKCRVCGRACCSAPELHVIALARNDAESRISELLDSCARHEVQAKTFQRKVGRQRNEKLRVDSQLATALEAYDSAYTSTLLELENHKASRVQSLADLRDLRKLTDKANDLMVKADELSATEDALRRDIKAARAAAAENATLLPELERLFLDCLIRSKVPGISAYDKAVIPLKDLYPRLTSGGEDRAVITDFFNISSGGKTTIFKCCFAIALHRLATAVNGPLPSFMIIDTPMKNISERINRDLFEGFYNMIFELSAGELSATQFVLIDKELCSPPRGFSRGFFERRMTPNDPRFPPLITTYRGS